MTNAIVIESLFEFEKNNFSSTVNIYPINEPSKTEHKISITGFIITEIRFIAPPIMACDIPIETANIISPAASSSATIGRSKSVTGPLALN